MGPEGPFAYSGGRTPAPVGSSPYTNAPHGASSVSSSPRQRNVIKTLNELDGMVYSLVFEGSLNRLSIRQLKQHLHEVTGIAVSGQVLLFEGVVLQDTASCGGCGIGGGALLSLRGVGGAVVPQAGTQPPQLPPRGAAMPVPQPRFDHDELPTLPAMPAPRSVAPSFAAEGHTNTNIPTHTHTHNHADAQLPDPALRRALEQNSERLRTIQQDEARLREQEAQLLREEATLVRRQQELERFAEHASQRREKETAQPMQRGASGSSGTYSNNGLTMEQLTRHNYMHDDEEDEIVSIEEMAPVSVRVGIGGGGGGGGGGYAKRVSPRGPSPGPSARSRSSAWVTQASDRGLELDSMWKLQSTKFDQHRETNAQNMKRLAAQLAEQEGQLAKLEGDVQQDMAFISQKRLIVDKLKSGAIAH